MSAPNKDHEAIAIMTYGLLSGMLLALDSVGMSAENSNRLHANFQQLLARLQRVAGELGWEELAAMIRRVEE